MDFKVLGPGVDYYENIFNDYECDHIIDQAKPLLSTSLVAGDKEGFISPGRTSSNCWLSHNKTPVIKNICDKIAYMTCNKLENAEKIQVIYYEKGGKYNPHYDAWDHDNSEKQKRNMKYGGQRLITALVYLNDVDEGGETSFPKKNIIINAKKGCMVVFRNCINNTNIKDPESIHTGMPVIRGEKWAFNLWFREENLAKIMYQDIVIHNSPVINQDASQINENLQEED
jgi:prolyl 4-hydroxylase